MSHAFARPITPFGQGFPCTRTNLALFANSPQTDPFLKASPLNVAQPTRGVKCDCYYIIRKH